MREILDNIDGMKHEAHKHPLFSFIESDKIPENRKLHFIPSMAYFIMSFRDMNKWIFSFTQPKNLFEKIINRAALEDQTHSRLFLEDWRKLRLDDHLAWKASDMMYWLFLSPEMESFRQYGIDFMKLCIEDGKNVDIRFAHCEVTETYGNVFFSRIAPIAEIIAKNNNMSLRYFGKFHLALENGHVVESEGAFENKQLTDYERQLASTLCKKTSTIFDGMRDAWLNYAQNYVVSNTIPITPDIDGQHERVHRSSRTNKCSPSQEIIQQSVTEHLQKIRNHEFFKWLHESDIDSLQKIQSFIPLWIFSIMEYRNLNKYIFIYPSPNNNEETLLNKYASISSQSSALFLQDWKSLNLDEVLRWTASDTLEFIFLHPAMDFHRKTHISLCMEGLRHTDPDIRFWFMNILELGNNLFFEELSPVVRKAEQDNSIILNYLAGRHYLKNIEHEKNDIEQYFYNKALSDSQIKAIPKFIELFFNACNESLNMSLSFGRENVFSIRYNL